jgi:alpha-beta hydrolase superfamily lysophospholipase
MNTQRQTKDNDVPISGSGESSKPTIVLVHGAVEDSSLWTHGVIQRLQREGYCRASIRVTTRDNQDDKFLMG